MNFTALLEKLDTVWRQALESGLVLPVVIGFLGTLAMCLAVPSLRQRTRRPIAVLGLIVVFAAASLGVARMAASKREAQAERAKAEQAAAPAPGKPGAKAAGAKDQSDSLVGRFMKHGKNGPVQLRPQKETGRVVINVRKGSETEVARRQAGEKAWLDGYEKLKRQRHDEARKSFEEARRRFGEGGEREFAEDLRGQALALQGMGHAARASGKPREAVGDYAAARDAFKKAGDRTSRIDAAEVDVAIAETQHDLGDGPAAKSAFRSALAEFDKLADEASDEAARLAGDAYRRYADFADRQKEEEEARKAAAKAAEHYEKVRGTLERAWADVAIAEMDAAAGRIAEARARILAARKALREHGAIEAEADATMAQGRIELAGRDFKAAEAAFSEVTALNRARKDARGEARALLGAAIAYRRADREKEANAAFEAADQAFLRAGDRRGRAEALFERGRLEADAGRGAAAVPYLAEAETAYRELGVLRVAALARERIEEICRGLPAEGERPERCRALSDRSTVPVPAPHRMGPR